MSENLFYYDAVSGRGGNSDGDWRGDRNCSGCDWRICDLFNHKQQYGNVHHSGNQPEYNYGGDFVFLCSRSILWNLSCEESSKTEPDRGFAAELMKTGLRWYFGVPVY